MTFETPDATSKLAGESVTWAHYPTTRNARNLIRNTRLAHRLLRELKPDVIVSTGAAVAVPFFWLTRNKSTTTVYLEVYDRVDTPTLTGRLCRPVSDLFLVQWAEQRSMYASSVLLGPVW
ncbi:UDP-N-acetylglucosamine--LPS N-acetylglucosamine transferase [Nocardioides sp. Bht2]|uniref:UDP-N-acetylglucosamine--LPS N-acetylglucosamine transferase n=1 Tax=Nocardioides sp. Bht2 TaxID=3392297 RepID=UPI0039B63AE0